MILGNVQSQGNRFLEMSMIRGTKIFSCPLLWVHYIMPVIIEFSTYHERLSQPIMKIGYWLHYFSSLPSCFTIVLGRIKFDCTLEDLHPVFQRKCFVLEHSILLHLLWIARVAKFVLSRANLLPILRKRSLTL